MNPEDSKQFDDIMGRNFTPDDESKMHSSAAIGALADATGVSDKIPSNLGKLPSVIGERDLPRVFSRFTPDDVHVDDKGVHAQVVQGPYTHKWRGGAEVEHYFKGDRVGVTPAFGHEWNGDNPMSWDRLASLGNRFTTEHQNPSSTVPESTPTFSDVSISHNFPESMVQERHGSPAVVHEQGGMTHVWSGGPTIQHSDITGRTRGYTDLSGTDYETMGKGKFLFHVSNFLNDPKNYRPADEYPGR